MTPVGGFFVDGSARSDEVRHVGNVDADFKVSVVELSAVQSVVDVSTARRVDGADIQVSTVNTGPFVLKKHLKINISLKNV